MRILVTGAAGFIGRHLVKELAINGHKVVATDMAQLDAPEGYGVDIMEHVVAGFTWDIRLHDRIPSFVEEARGCDALIHLAAIAAPRIAAANPLAAWDTNVRGTFNVLDLARRAEIRRVLFFSSAHVYGISPKYMPTDETAPLVLHDTYTVTKILGEDLCWKFFGDCHMTPTIFRLFNCYGPGQNPDYFLGAKLAQATEIALACRRQPYVEATRLLEVKGSEITKDWIHVSDVVRAARLTIESFYSGELNIGTGVETNLGELGKQIAEGFGIGVALGGTDDPGPTRMRASIDRIKAVLRWQPKVAVRDGLAELIALTKKEAGL